MWTEVLLHFLSKMDSEIQFQMQYWSSTKVIKNIITPYSFCMTIIVSTDKSIHYWHFNTELIYLIDHRLDLFHLLRLKQSIWKCFLDFWVLCCLNSVSSLGKKTSRIRCIHNIFHFFHYFPVSVKSGPVPNLIITKKFHLQTLIKVKFMYKYNSLGENQIMSINVIFSDRLVSCNALLSCKWHAIGNH